jgi:hypothetical protein
LAPTNETVYGKGLRWRGMCEDKETEREKTKIGKEGLHRRKESQVFFFFFGKEACDKTITGWEMLQEV